MFFHDMCVVIFARAAREPSTLHVNEEQSHDFYV